MFRPLSKHVVEAELEPERPERLGLGKVSPGAGSSWDPRSVYGHAPSSEFCKWGREAGGPEGASKRWPSGPVSPPSAPRPLLRDKCARSPVRIQPVAQHRAWRASKTAINPAKIRQRQSS